MAQEAPITLEIVQAEARRFALHNAGQLLMPMAAMCLSLGVRIKTKLNKL